MCVILYKLFKCGCKEDKSIDPCPMMDQVLDLVDMRGVPEDDHRIQRLEGQYGEKSAARYEIQRGICDRCNASIAAVGMEAWSVAKGMRDLEEESKCHAEIGIHEATARAPQKPLVGFDDDYYDYNTSTASMKTTKAVRSQPGPSAMDSLDNKKDAGSPEELELALGAVLAAREDLADFYDDENICDADDDDEPLGAVDDSVVRASRSAVPSPSYGPDSTDSGLDMKLKNAFLD
jgi:hypothetical protein